MSAPYTVRWGILGPGWIAGEFSKDLVLDPSTRGVTDIKHIVQAAASATSLERAKTFLSDVGAPNGTAYGSYEELVADPNVDIIYIATPHSHHFPQCLLALNAGKPVVCEKPFTVNTEQTRILVELARKKGLFLMEAVWTRFFPISVQIRSLIKEGRIGEVKRVFADLSMAQAPEEKYDDSHRMVNPDLAGGVLLDLGVYSLTWVYQTLYHTLPAAVKPQSAPTITGTISKYERTGVDAENAVIVKFPNSIGIATSSIRVAADPEDTNHTAIKIQGTLGEIRVDHPAYAPAGYSIIVAGKGAERVECPVPAGKGMHWEADEAARCLRDGKLESETMPLEESLLVMEAMDSVRAQAGFRYPEVIESTEH
ncbi:uncharacterized protein H6S33_011240 [Morchella sextelata]|uniref:uncharacterized protein n=1 Tax=Morchella sextelata TaxID=1174677 RepID=UPI001D054C51|nr:uncharacterized protein H6S33_011240 [Morchella sextelata]KAH0610813.1 hypothetical protein H6S33_011240 [Morchella sextelata]